MMVGEKGLEPITLAGPVPKTGAYTNSATRPNYVATKSSLHVRPVGFEPTTNRLRGERSTN
jgi:hypothetical protein